MTQYRCGKASENTGLGESPHCMELTERIDNKVEDGTSNWAYDICTETVTERRETGGGSEGGSGEESAVVTEVVGRVTARIAGMKCVVEEKQHS